MTTLTATDARSRWFQLIKETLMSHLPTLISSKEGNAVLLSEEDYESLLETAELLSIPGFKESLKESDKDVKEGRIYPMEEIFRKK